MPTTSTVRAVGPVVGRTLLGSATALTLLLTSSCGLLDGGGRTTTDPASSPASPSPASPAQESPSSSGGHSPKAETSPAGGPSTPEGTPGGTARSVHVDGAALVLPRAWEEADVSSTTVIRDDGTTPDDLRVWQVHLPDAPDIPVASLEHRLDRASGAPAGSEEDRREAIREWASTTVDSLRDEDEAVIGQSLELFGLGCAAGTVELDGEPSLEDFGTDGADQAIRIDYTCTAFRDPSLGEVLGIRWITTDVDGRRLDFYATAYTGWLDEEAEDPEVLDRIVESIGPTA